MAIITSIFATNSVSSLLRTSAYRNFVAPFALLASTQIHIHRNSHFSGHRNRGLSCKSSVAASIDVNSDATSIISSIGNPKHGRLLPCPSHHGPPRIEHFVTDGGTVLEYITKALDLHPLLLPLQ